MGESVNHLHNFIQFKLLAPEAIKKCQRINKEEKEGQPIILDKYNSRDFSSINNVIINFKKINYTNTDESEKLHNNLNIIFEKTKLIKETHNKTLAIFNSRLNK